MYIHKENNNKNNERNECIHAYNIVLYIQHYKNNAFILHPLKSSGLSKISA